MKKQMLFIIVLLGMFSLSFSQTPPDTLWTKTFGGIDDEYCKCVIQTSDGGFALAGYTWSFGAGEEDMYLVRTNASGDTLWTRSYGSNCPDYCESIIQTTDGGFLLAGWTNYSGENYNGYLVKTYANGDTMWTKKYEGEILFDYGSVSFFSVVPTLDGNYSIVGACGIFLSHESCLIKINSNGDTLWARKYNPSDTTFAVCMNHIQTTDGGFALANTIGTYDSLTGEFNEDGWIVRTDSNGDTLWTHVFGGEENDEFHSIVENPDGGFSLAGDTQIDSTYYFWQVCTDNLGNELWSYNYYDENCICRAHIRTYEGNYVLAGMSGASGGGSQFLVILTDSQGISQWSVGYQYIYGDSYNRCNTVIQTNDLGFVLAGYTEPFSTSNRDFWMIRTNSGTGIDDDYTTIPKKFTLSQNYPNPFNPETTISFSIPKDSKVEVSIYNIKGQKVKTLANENFQRGFQEVFWNGKDENGKPVSSGIYFFKMETDNFSEIKKAILLK